MASFTDDLGRSWELRLTPLTMATVEKETEINLGRALGGEMKGLQELFEDFVALSRVLTALVKTQLPQQGLNADTFMDQMVGDTLERAGEAFIEAVLDFCPSRQAKILRAEMAKTMKEQEAMLKKLESDQTTYLNTGTNSRASSVSGIQS